MKGHQHIPCQNCGTKTIGKYCHRCAQSASTTRLDLKHFIQHDIVHGVFHFETGLLFTLKEILIRPGQVAIDYIQGKRKKYYNFFYLTLIIIGVILFVKGIYKQLPAEEVIAVSDEYEDGVKLAQKNLKLVFLAFIPLLVLCSKIVYKKLQFNLAEHSIIAVVNVIYFLLIVLFANILYLVARIFSFELGNINTYMVYIGILNFARVYYQSFKQFFKNKNTAVMRGLLTVMLFTTFLFLSLMLWFFILKQLHK